MTLTAANIPIKIAPTLKIAFGHKSFKGNFHIQSVSKWFHCLRCMLKYMGILVKKLFDNFSKLFLKSNLFYPRIF